MKSGMYIEYNSCCKFPFPFGNRDVIMRQWCFLNPDKKRASLFYESRKGVPKNKGFIRADISCKF